LLGPYLDFSLTRLLLLLLPLSLLLLLVLHHQV
jgi:hypothetical protein